MPYPDNLDRHFVVDPTKYDFYVMDCHRHLAEDRMAESLASELIRASTDFDGTERAPTRQAEETWKQRSIRASRLSAHPQVAAVPAHGQPRSHTSPQRPTTRTNPRPWSTST